MKSQSKTEKAVKMGKVVDDATYNNLVSMVSGFDSLSDFYNSPKGGAQAVNALQQAGVVNEKQMAELYDGEKLSEAGRALLESVLIGKAFEGNADMVRMLSEFPSLRRSVVQALTEIGRNKQLGNDYNVTDELAEAVKLAYNARKQGYTQGQSVSAFARQLNLFPFDEGSETVADYTNATILMLADALNDNRETLLRNSLALYNDAANDAAAGQLDIFGGGVRSKETIIKDVLNFLNNGERKEQRAALNDVAERRKANATSGAGSTEENGTDGASDETGAVNEAVAQAEAETDTTPTDAQKEAGNYKKGHVKIDGFDITIENPKGSERSGTDASGKKWSITMQNTYGYIRGTEGVDGDHIDVFLSDNPTEGNVFVVDQVNKDGSFDEHKVMYGFPDAESARRAYLANYEEGWQGLGAITPVSKEEFKKWINSSHRKTKPFAEYSSVKPLEENKKVTDTKEEDAEIRERINEYRKEYPDNMVFPVRHADGSATYYDNDARIVAELLGVELDGTKLTVDKEQFDKSLQKLIATGRRVGMLKSDNATVELSSEQPEQKKPAEKKATKPKKDASAPKTSGARTSGKGKIGDVGERLEGARKDMLKVLSKTFEDATVQALIELPFSKAFKKPDLKKAVESGALREEDALFYETLFALINTNKPKDTKSELWKKKKYENYETSVEKWAKQTHNILSFLKEFVEATPEQRDIMMRTMMENHYPGRDKELAEIEKRKELNKDYTYTDKDGKEHTKKYEWGDKTTPNMVWVMHEILSRLGYEVGDKMDIPYGVIKASADGLYYGLTDNKNDKNYAIGTFASIEDAIDAAVYLAKVKRGDTDLQHPKRLFSVVHTKTTYKDSGKYRVVYGRNLNEKQFDSKEEADKFVKEKEARAISAYASPIQEVDERTDYVITFYHPLTGKKMQIDNEKFATKAEALAYLSENMESVNEAVNEKLRAEAEQKGQKKEITADDMMHVSYTYNVANKTASYAVYMNKEVANNYGMPAMLREGFQSREEAKQWLEEHKTEVFDIYKKAEAQRKAYVYFSSGQDTRAGEDYRNGKDVTAEDFMNEFGFRGVQFGNWTNQTDRQMAINQAYDALIDMAHLLGVSPKALSLDGKLGIAFGSRGSGNANAHFERDEFVINLTKTRGAGSLAHEWWHALDSYFAKQAGMELGMVTEQTSLEMRKELREAYNNLVDVIKETDYYERSRKSGSYWGSIVEVTARLFAEWVDRELKKRGELNTFLSRGADEERWQQMMYDVHRATATVSGKEPMTFDEFKQTKESLKGYPYPSTTEVEELGDDVRNIFETVQERIDEESGAVALFHKASEEASEVSEQEGALRDALVETMRNAGIEVVADEQEGQRVLDMVNGENATLSKAQKRAAETVSVASNEEHHQTVVSTTDGAKVLNNLDNLATNLESLTQNPVKTFLGEVAKALEATKHGSNSQYATFETKNGKIVTIRLANHNAKVSTFDNHGEDEGISIVVSPKNNTGTILDGNAHVVEYYYNVMKLRRAEGKPLADIVRAIKQSLYSGEFNDPTGIAERQEVNKDIIREHRSAKDNVSQEIFVSNARRAVEGIKQEKATAEQWLAMLQKNGGLKAGEDKWLGLSDWLKDKKGSVTKQEILDFIAENQIQIEDVHYAENLSEEALGIGEEGTGLINSMRLSYTTKGLQNKREIALVVPAIEPYNKHDEIHFGDAGEGRAVAWCRFGETTDKDGKRVLVIDEIQSKRHQDGREKGYRTNSVEELNRLSTEVENNRHAYSNYENEIIQKYDIIKGRALSSDDVVGEILKVASPDEIKKLRDLREAELNSLAAKEEYEKTHGVNRRDLVPDAPFDKNWHELVMKRMLRYAAENGYDKVAWTTGKQQAKRYSLSNKIEDFYYKKNEDGTYNISALAVVKRNGYTDYKEYNYDNQTEKQLTELLGKDITAKIVSGKGRKGYTHKGANDWTTFKGKELEMGGEGMKGFYDEILPRFMNKYGKKWGAQVGETELPQVEETGRRMWSVDVTPQMKESVMMGQPMFFRTANGKAYGFVKDGKMYIDPSIATSETPVHEYTHLWAEALRKGNPEKWEEIKRVLLNDESVKPFIDKVRSEYPELTNEDDLLDEVLAQYSGKRGSERLRAEAQRIADSKDGAFEKADVYRAMNKLKDAIRRFWQAFADFMHVPYRSADEIADRVMYDLLSGVNPRQEAEKMQQNPHKARQLEIVTKENPMRDDYHTGIRSIDDIKTYEEAVNEGEGMDMYPDFTEEDARKALESGEVTVYSSNPIENGVFVSTSRKEAEDYAGGGKVYSKRVPLSNVAWLQANEGQYAEDSEKSRDEAYKEAVENGDTETAQRMVDAAAESAGYEYKVYHQTDNDFTVFDPRHKGSGTNDYLMPFGIFLKPTDRNIGINGKKQMPLYAKINNPLRFADREELQNWLDENIVGYKAAREGYERIDKDFKKRFDEQEEQETERYTELWNRWKAGEISEEEYQQKISETDGTQALLDEWKEAVNKQSAVMKELVDAYMRDSEYDGIIVNNDRGSFGRQTQTILVFEPEQVKSADVVTYDDAGNIIPLSKRFNSKEPDIRFQKEEDNAALEEIQNRMERAPVTIRDDAEKTKEFVKNSIERQVNMDTSLLVRAQAKAEKAKSQKAKDNALADVEMYKERINRCKHALEILKTDEGATMQREGDGRVLSMSQDKNYSRKQRWELMQREWKRMQNKAKEYIDILKLDRIAVYGTVEDMPEGMRNSLSERKKKAKGWYDTKTGKIVIILGNHRNAEDVAKTILHEAVAHYGLRKLFGKNFDTFLDNVYQNADVDVKMRIADMAARQRAKDSAANRARRTTEDYLRIGTEEYLAKLAEDMDFENRRESFWSKIKSLFIQMLESIGLKDYDAGVLSDNELKYILWRSYKNLSSPGEYRSVFDVAEDIVMQENLGVGNFTRGEMPESMLLPSEMEERRRVAEQGMVGEDDRFNDTDDGEIVSEEELNSYDAGKMSLSESITQGLIKLARENKDNLQLRVDAMRALNGDIQKLRSAMSRQRDYDRSTVDSIVRLARMVMGTGYFNNFSNYEVRRLLSAINNATGKEDITHWANTVVDILMQHQLREAKELFERQMRVRGSKVDSRGVEVQAGLDITGQRIVSAFKDAMEIVGEETDSDGNLTAWGQRIADVYDRMGSDDEVTAQNAAAEYQGMMLAKQWYDEVRSLEQEEKNLRADLKDAEERKRNGQMSYDEYKQFVKATEDAIRENRMERIDGYGRLAVALGTEMRTSVEKAKAFREDAIERVNEIHHNANSDLEGIPADEHRKLTWQQSIANWSIVRFFMKSLPTFDEMLRFFGSKSVDGKGYLWNRFMGGWTDAADREWKQLKAAHETLDKKVSEVFGKNMKWSDIFSMERKMPTITVEFWDGGERKNHQLTAGNALYIYMVNKMTDGKMKLRKMGITEEDVANIAESLDPRLIQLADWLQDDFLVNKRKDYNAVHERMFGAPMAAIDNYFPLRINDRSRGKEEEIGAPTTAEARPSTVTGSVIKRVRNTTALDIMGTDAFDVVLEHLQEMEHWAAFAELSRDLNTLCSYKRFRNRVLNMSSVRFGAGETLWKNFKDCCAIATGVYTPMVNRNSLDTAMVNVAKGVTAAKISFRIYTALKQLLSYPAYLSEANIVELAKTTFNPVGAAQSWNWAIENLPGFAERWQSRRAGDSRLLDTDADWQFWRNKIVETASRWGMSPNAFVDGLTVSMGAKAIYETKKKRYLADGYSEEDAEKKALLDASVAYNETQQSSMNAYLSAMQVDRTAASVALTVFRNASMAYQRRMFRAMSNLKRKMRRGYKNSAIEYMAKQYQRNGLGEGEALASAIRDYNHSWYEDVANTVIFGFVMQFAWNLGPYLAYMIGGDDDDDKEEMLVDAALHALAGGIEGLTGGSVMSELYNMLRKGESVKSYNFNLLPLMSDVQNILRKLDKDKVEAANDIINLLVQAGIGVNPQSLTDAFVAVMDYSGGDYGHARETALLILRIMNCPQSQLDKLMIDELGMTARDAQKLSVEDIAYRYAEYKVRRGAPLTGWAYSDEGEYQAAERKQKLFNEKVGERVKRLSDGDLESVFNRGDNTLRKLAGKEAAERMGGKDTYGSPSKNNLYGQVYSLIRDYNDMAEDILLQNELKKAKQKGDTDRVEEINAAIRDITSIKKDLAETPFTLEDGTEITDKDVMKDLREVRKEYIKELVK
jgi:hypothetical protein